MNINTLNKYLFRSLIGFTHKLTETETRNIIGKPVLRALGSLTLAVKKGREKPSLSDAAEEWQRMFPSKKMVPIVNIEDDKVTAEIHTECPYRGSGNVEGCYRMMEYDRKIMEKIGADFTVVRSQAEPGITHCQVIISKNAKDLPPEAKDRIAAKHISVE